MILITVTWGNKAQHDIRRSPLYKSFTAFNKRSHFKHFHFHRSHYRSEETLYRERFGFQGEYILYKIHFLRTCLEQHVRDDYVIFTDAYDVACLSRIDHLKSVFDLDNYVILGAEKNRWPPLETTAKWPQFKDYPNEDVSSQRFVNSGVILAKRARFIEMLQSIEDNILALNIPDFINDQPAYTWHYTARHQPYIKLDSHSILVLNTYQHAHDEYILNHNREFVSLMTGIKPCFVHDNGWNHGSPRFITHFDLANISRVTRASFLKRLNSAFFHAVRKSSKADF